MQQLMFVSCSYCENVECFSFYKCFATSIKCASLFVKIGVNYPQAIISMKVTALHTATIKGGMQLLRKSGI